MSARSTLMSAVSILGSAIAAAAAVESGRQPRARDLRGLGIDPKQFREIKGL
jgi:hypothetical protein